MRILIIYPGHSHSTYDVAHGYDRALRLLGHRVRAFNYHTQLAFYMESINHWLTNPANELESPDEAIMLLASEQAVIEVVDFVPDVVLIVNGFALHRRAYDLIDRLCIPMVLIATESPYMDPEQINIAKMGHVKLVFANDKSSLVTLRDAGLVAEYLPHSFDPSRHYPRQEDDPSYWSDVYFFGTMWPERQRLIDALKARAEPYWRLDCDGVALMTGRNAHGLVDNDEMARRYCGARIALNHHRTIREIDIESGAEHHIAQAYSLGPRAFEIAACGAFQLCDDTRPELADVFGDTVATYHDADDLADKVGYWLDRDYERQEMAREAWARAQACAFEQRAADILLPAIQEAIGK